MKKVLIITYYWPPSGGAGVQRWLKMAKYLPEFGWEPVVLTVDTLHASYPVSDAGLMNDVSPELEIIRTKSFEPLKLYGKLFGRKKIPYSGFSNVQTDNLLSRLTRWVRGNLFIPDARKGWNPYALKAALNRIAQNDIQHIITTGPPHSTHLIGQAIKKQFPDIKWIADFRDPWTDIYYYRQLLHSHYSARQDKRMESNVLREADLVVSVCASNKTLLATKLPSSAQLKLVEVTNGFDPDDFQNLAISDPNKRFVIAYTGTLAESYDVEPIIKILSQLKFNWELQCAGSIAPEIDELFSRYGIRENLNFRGYISHSKSLQILFSSDCLLHILPNVDGAKMGTTGKLFEYLGVRKPILNFGSVEGDSALIIEKAGAGRTFDRQDQVGVLAYLSQLNEGSVIISNRVEQFSRRNTTKIMAKHLDNLL